MACSSTAEPRPAVAEKSSCGGKEAHCPSDFFVGPADRIVGAAPIDKRARAADLKNVANPADHDRPSVAVDDFLAFAFERGDGVGSKHNTARRRHPTSLEIVRARLDQSPTAETIRDLGMARSEDADAERRLRRRGRRMCAAQSKESRRVGGSTDRNETEVAVTPNQSAPRWKVTTLTARGNCRRASRQATSLC